jgi:cell division protease FtsH
MLVLCVGLIASWLARQPRRDLSYTRFKHHVRQGHVEQVTIEGNAIRGRFSSSYLARRAQTRGDRAGAAESAPGFTTFKPSVADPGLLDLLERNDVEVHAESADASLLANMLVLFVPWLLLLGLLVYANRRIARRMRGTGGAGPIGGSGLFGMGRSRARKVKKTRATTRFTDVAGLDNAKNDLKEIVGYLREPTKYTALGASIPKGVLLMGPPGTGKTLLARASAGEARVPFFSISGSEFIEMFVGVGASRVRDMFATAKKESPAIIFIDEIDSVGRTRGAGLGGGHDEREQTLNQILAEMDGFEPHESVVVIAATNRPDVLDPALTRPGRFDRQISLDMPQKQARAKILAIHSRAVPMAEDVDIDKLAARTVGFSGADLRNLVNEAALLAGRRGKKRVEKADFDEASDKIMLGAEREERVESEERRVIAYHEGGHALMAKLLPGTDPLQKVTIIPRGRSLGATEQVPEADRHNFSRSYLLDRMAVALGGRAAECIVFDELTNGAAQDLKVVTSFARRMVCQWGMSDTLGPVTYSQGEEHIFLGRELARAKDYSEDTARQIDQEIRRIILESEQRARELLSRNRKKLDRLAQALLQEETLSNAQIERLFATINEEQDNHGSSGAERVDGRDTEMAVTGAGDTDARSGRGREGSDEA